MRPTLKLALIVAAAIEIASASAMGADLRWVAASAGQVPPGAVMGGQESGHAIPICRASHGGGVHPGKVVGQNCNIGWGGKEVPIRNYEVLVGPASGIRWVPAQGGQVPPDAFVGGQEGGRQLVVCRVHHNNGVHPGKLVGQNCNIGWGGKEVVVRSYEVLVTAAVATAAPSGTPPEAPAPAIPPVAAVQSPAPTPAPVPTPAPPAAAPLPAPVAGGPSVPAWVRASMGDRPDFAMLGGQDDRGAKLYVCRAIHEGGLHPGWLFGHTCQFGSKGAEIEGQQYEVLTGDATLVHWVAAQNGKHPPGVLLGGKDSGADRPVCRATKEGGTYPGRVIGTKCQFTWHAQEDSAASYEVLVAPAAGR